VELHEVELEPQDGLLLCSDGLTDVVSSDELTRIFSQHLDPQAACGACLEAALKAGAPDNVTVVVAFCQDPDVSGDTPP
jgi:protein phosphatase